MAHYAFLDENNIVTQVITGCKENELVEGVTSWEEFYGNFVGQKCLRTSYNTFMGKHKNGGIPFRGNYAGIGYSYNEELDAFIPPKPYKSWILNKTTFTWDPPIPCPIDDKIYTWDEDNKIWKLLEI